MLGPKELVLHPWSVFHVHTFLKEDLSQALSITCNLLTPKSLTQAPCSRHHMDISWVSKANKMSNRIHHFCLNLPILDLPTPNQAKGIPETHLTSSPLPHPFRHVSPVCSPHCHSPSPGLYIAFLDNDTSLLYGLATANVSPHSRTCSTMAATWTLNQ